jgi:hypothetical protein
MQNPRLPSPAHPSLQRHRRELWTRILIPIILAAAVIAAIAVLAGLAAFGQGSDQVGRWAAISTMWILVPLLAAGILLLVLLVGVIYGLSLLIGTLPNYTVVVQDFFQRITGIAKRLSDGSVKPILAVGGVLATLRRLLGMK